MIICKINLNESYYYNYFNNQNIKMTNDKNVKKDKNVQLALPKEQVDLVLGLYSSGKINEAIDAIKALNGNYPNVPLLFNLLGACHNTLGQLDAAAQMFKTAFSIKPDYAEAYFNHGIVLRELGQFDLAVESYKTAIELIPNYPEAHNKLGITYIDLKQYDAAIEHLEWAVAYKHDFAEAYNNLGVAHRENNQIQSSIKNFEKAIAINSSYTLAHSNLEGVRGELEQKDG